MHRLVFFLLLLWPLTAWPATYYVSTSGSDSNNCSPTGAQSQSTPKRTIAGPQGGVTCLTAGDTLLIRGGTYAEALRTSQIAMPSGTSWSTPITIAGFPGEQVTLTGDNVIAIDFSTGSGIAYVIFRNLILDMSSHPDAQGIFLGRGVHHIRFDTIEAIGVITGDPATGQSGIQGGGTGAEPAADAIEFLNSNIHGWRGYGFYLIGTNWLLDHNQIHHNGGYGVHMFHSGSSDVNNNTVRNCDLYANGQNTPVTTFGIILSSGDNNSAYNNVIRDQVGGGGNGGIQISAGNTTTNAKVYNNTIYNNQGPGIEINNTAFNTLITNNLVVGNGGRINDSGNATVFTTNLCDGSGVGCAFVGTPSFANPGAGDLHLNAGSVGLNLGTTLAAVPTDKDGVSRPQDTAYDLGAYERIVAGGGGACTTACTVYVAPTGDDSRACNTAGIATPRQTFAGGLACLTQPGSTLYLRAGTYANVAVDTGTTFIAGGTSWSAPTTIAGYANETVTLQLASGQTALFWFRNTTNDHYIVLDRLILDAQSFLNSDAILLWPGVHHIRFQNGEIKNTYYHALYMESTTGIEVLRSKLHDALNAPVVTVAYTATGTLMDGNDIAASGWGGVVADGNDHPGSVLPDITLRGNVLHGLGTAQSQPAVRVGGPSNTGAVLTNNVVYGNYAGIQITNGASGAKVYNNTVYSNTTVGVQIDAGATSTDVVNTISSENGGQAILNNGTSTSLGTNLTVTPPYVNAGAGDFHLQASAIGAINVGTTLATVTTDYDGVSRPQGSAYDIGAFEFVGTPFVPPTVQIRAPYWMSTGRFGR